MNRIDPKKYAFDLGKEVLGQSAGGFIVKLAQHCKTNWWAVISHLEKAENAADPREYLGAILRGESRKMNGNRYASFGYREATQAELEAFWQKFPQSRGCRTIPNWWRAS